ncbi:FAD-binding oxidoreductase [Pontiellaceae bacterium B12227]|nr:FAD-binding oxidoreductase [Pontiellaceae bacterium B12227]
MNFSEAIKLWKSEVGPDAVIDNFEAVKVYTRSVCASRREVIAVLKPQSHEQVEKIVEIANRFETPLYPISCGKQWGMGSKLPVRDGAAIVDLSGMKRIIEISEQFQYVIVEPGVTQRQLLDYIKEKNLPLMLNVTGSSSDTSLIGNAMDRGVGYFSTRADEILNMRVVLGSGRSIRTGFGHIEDAKTKNLYSYGTGPSLDGIFMQGNFGIVTSACIGLMPMPECKTTVAITIQREDDLQKLVDALVGLRKHGHIRTIAHIGNKERSHISFAPHIYEELVKAGDLHGKDLLAKTDSILKESGFGPWSAGIGIIGSKKVVQMTKKEIRKAVGGFAKVTFLDEWLIRMLKFVASSFSWIPGIYEKGILLRSILPVAGFAQGQTTDASLKTVYWPAGDLENLLTLDPDQTNSGTLFCLPLIPASGVDVRNVVRETVRVFSEYGFAVAITVNVMNSKCLEGVVSLAFDRRDEDQVKKAHACIQKMEGRYMEMGYPPYRVGINSMHHIVAEDEYWHTVKDLKRALDPNNIVAPGRYNLV